MSVLIQPSQGNVHQLELTDDIDIALASPADGARACLLELYCDQDATGGHTITWPGSVVWPGGVTPEPITTALTTTRYTLETIDGGTTWYGAMVGGGSTTTGTGTPPQILLESGHAVPFTFDEILQESDGSDFLWASE